MRYCVQVDGKQPYTVEIDPQYAFPCLNVATRMLPSWQVYILRRILSEKQVA